ETAFDQAYLASVLGLPLVESADLVVRDGKLWMRSMGTLKRVDFCCLLKTPPPALISDLS
ncbi:circularly permuted type 2 ATP-grasp protein, partial [Mycolicibacterium vaccae]|nr:circularly permuted type 2 ATP-grasp protein [Mycolicibacterium vaccae]